MESVMRPMMATVLAATMAAGAVGCERSDRPPPQSQMETARVSLFNATHDILPFRTQELHGNYVVDCDLVAAMPDRFLSDAHMSNPRNLADQAEHYDQHPFSGVELPLMRSDTQEALEANRDCQLTVLRSVDDRLPTLALSWPTTLEEKTFYSDVDAPKDVLPEPHTLVAEAIYDDVSSDDLRPWRHRPCEGSLTDCPESEYERLIQPPSGADYHWSVIGDAPDYEEWEPVALEDRPVADPEDDAQCNTGRSDTPLRWDPPSLVRTWRVLAVDEYIEERDDAGDHGEEQDPGDQPEQWTCHEVMLEAADGSDNETTWSFCGSRRLATTIESPGMQGDVEIDFYTEIQDDSPPAVYKSLAVELKRKTEEGELFETETVELVQGHWVPEHIGLNWETEVVDGCEARREVAECDQIIAASHLKVEAANEIVTLRPGETVALDTEASRRVEYVRGFHRAVLDLRCQDDRLGPDRFANTEAYLEFLYYAGPSRVDD